MLVDPAAFALLALSLAFAVHRRGPLLLTTLLLCAATKETALIGAAFGVFWAVEKRDWKLLRWAVGGMASSGSSPSSASPFPRMRPTAT